MANLNETSSGEETIVNKDEQGMNIVHENGYESERSSRSDEDVARSALEIEADAFTRFIERQRVEVMFELRHLRLGERPVTGQSNRQRIEGFLNHIHQRAPSTQPAVPSAHIADINALTNRRCVSAALGSAAFRQDLENAVRRSIETRPATSIPPAPPLPRTLAPMNIEHQNPPIVPPSISEQPTLIQEPFSFERQERELHAWQTITQLQREIIVLEISDLVHRQLVTSALESDFRTHLEQNVFTRLQRGAPPEPPTTAVITPVHIPPAPAPIRTTTTTNVRASGSTVDELSSRLDGMQRMLQLIFSMQMDMQKTLRHEVASAIANTSSTVITSSSQPMNAGHCTVCLTALADTVLYRCGHLCVCYMCGLNLRATTSVTGVKCPICRAPVDDILRVYRSSRDGE